MQNDNAQEFEMSFEIPMLFLNTNALTWYGQPISTSVFSYFQFTNAFEEKKYKTTRIIITFYMETLLPITIYS